MLQNAVLVAYIRQPVFSGLHYHDFGADEPFGSYNGVRSPQIIRGFSLWALR